MFCKEVDFKDTQIGRLPKAWDVVRLEAVLFELIGGGTPSTAKREYWNGEIPWMTSAHITGSVVTNGQRYITKEGLGNSATHIVPKGNLLVSTRVGIGKAALNMIDIAISQDLTGVVIDGSKVSSQFLYWFIISNVKRLKSLAQGSTIQGILREDLSRMLIPCPSISEQHGIAEVLSYVDLAIQKTSEVIAKTERLKKGLMQKLLTEGIGHKEFKDTPIGKIPKEWQVRKVSDLFVVETGATPSTKKEEYWRNGTINWITPTDLSKLNGRILIRNGERGITEKATQDTSLTLMPKCSLIISTRAPVGYVAILEEPATFNQGCKGLIPKDSHEVCSGFYCYYLLSKKQMLQNMSGGSTFKELSKQRLEAFCLPALSFSEQERIAEILSTVCSKLELERNEKVRLERIKRGLMGLLLTGKVRIRVD